ncbi:MAG TPA: sensor histidine kinase [Anaerolineae bacterium]|nr:sensor histidine kinase [Anaerolineae bacterium]
MVWIFYLTAGLLFGAAMLRSLLYYGGTPVISQVLGLLMVWLVLLIASETAISRRWSRYFPIYLILQSALIFALLLMPDASDFFAVLFWILSMQIMRRFSPSQGAVWIGLFTPLMTLPLVRTYGLPKGMAFALAYTAGNVLSAAYAFATQRAQTARAQNHILAQELQEANRQLQAHSAQLEQLAVARERHRLARELHDSVTQTIFSMTLTTQSAVLLMDRDPGRVGAQLDRLGQLARSALSEMRVLISELRPGKAAEGGLIAALRRHLADGHLPENLAVSLEVAGDQLLAPAEEQSLFRIAQEALNNIVKHARASQAQIRLHLAEPFWMEIQDQGQGFDLQRARISGRVGLVSMGERAAEIGWRLQVITSPGAGTRVRVEKKPSEGRQP